MISQVSADEKVREIYRLRQETDASIISERNLYALEARKEGERIGMEKAEAKARQEKIESARKMLKKGFDISDIAEISGLSIEEIQNLK